MKSTIFIILVLLISFSCKKDVVNLVVPTPVVITPTPVVKPTPIVTYVDIIDPIFESYLIFNNYDSDGLINGKISTKDALNVGDINFNDGSYPNVRSLKGIESFLNLNRLLVNNSSISSLDISKNTNLEYLDCSNTNITTFRCE